jgi:hypothetical protein
MVGGVGGVLNRASVPSQCLRGVRGVSNRTGNRTGERAPSVPDGELVIWLNAGIARRGRRFSVPNGRESEDKLFCPDFWLRLRAGKDC